MIKYPRGDLQSFFFLICAFLKTWQLFFLAVIILKNLYIMQQVVSHPLQLSSPKARAELFDEAQPKYPAKNQTKPNFAFDAHTIVKAELPPC